MPSHNIEIRPAIAEDVGTLWPLVQDFAFSYRPERSVFEQSFRELVERNDTLVMVAVEDVSTTVGYLLGSYHGTFFANGPVAWIEELMVSESARRRGVATQLVAQAETWARSVPTAYVALASRRAGAFYLGLGYEESATYLRKTFVPHRS
jgi:GNAT superfamily N-acetyltransferase